MKLILNKIILLIIAGIAFSEKANAQSQIDFPNPIGQKNIESLVNAVLEVVVNAGAIVVVFFLIYSGYLFVEARGNSGKLEKAKETFVWTIVGGLIVLGAFVISEVVQNTVNQITG